MHRSGAPGRTFAAVCASGVLLAGAVVAAPVVDYLTRVRVFFDAGQRRAVFEVPTHVRQRASSPLASWICACSASTTP
jgi:hypothetical protein